MSSEIPRKGNKNDTSWCGYCRTTRSDVAELLSTLRTIPLTPLAVIRISAGQRAVVSVETNRTIYWRRIGLNNNNNNNNKRSSRRSHHDHAIMCDLEWGGVHMVLLYFAKLHSCEIHVRNGATGSARIYTQHIWYTNHLSLSLSLSLSPFYYE